ncbi:Mitochondrial GTPase [Boothiomyces sp. JEL0866]|nr:Mitochondrial GTPase [Boothiomyces sp. JEL0866]
MKFKNPFGFRTAFDYNSRIFWYPPHQAKALMQLKNGIHHIDLVVEVRDARIPLTCLNSVLLNRKKLVVYNKVDLANPQLLPGLKEYLQKYRQEDVIFTKANEGFNVKGILKYAIEYCKSDPIRFPYLSVVVVGAPNVGKSTLINQLRNLGMKKKKVTQVGPKAGVTRMIQTRVKIHPDPPIYLTDTPGIFNPIVSTPIDCLKIALTGGTNDSLTTKINVADYLLFRLNNSKNYQYYCQILEMEPTDNIYEILLQICKKYEFEVDENTRINRLLDEKDFDMDKAAELFIDLYRRGQFGRMTLDNCSKEGLDEFFNQNQTDSLYYP